VVSAGGIGVTLKNLSTRDASGVGSARNQFTKRIDRKW